LDGPVKKLTVRVLGEFAVDGLDLTTLGSRKARQLLLLLALGRGRPVAVDRLIDALWGDGPPANPADQLAVLVSRVRRRIGAERVARSDAGYRLQYDWLDVDELDAAVAEAHRRGAAGNARGAVAAVRVALTLMRGEPTTAGMDSEWVVAQVGSVRRGVDQARRAVAGVLVGAGQCLDAIDVLRSDLDVDSYDEDRVRLLMRAEAGAGRTGAALAAFAALRERLQQDLGTDPAPATLELHTAIVRGELGVPAPPIRAGSGRLVGRDRELRRLDELAERAMAEGPIVVVIRGEAGIGKTTLLAAWRARRAADGAAVLHGSCGLLERAVPLDAVMVALAQHLRGLPAPEVAAVLGPERELLAPMLGLEPSPRSEPLLADRDLGPMVLFGALTTVLGRLTERQHLALVLDDAHLAGPALAEWLRFLVRRPMPLLVLVAARPDEGAEFSATLTMTLGPLDLAAVTELVGADRAPSLHARSGGHPLFLAALAVAGDHDLPESLIAAVRRRCDELGEPGDLVRAAAVLGPRLDVDLLAAVFRRPTMAVLDDVELAARRGLLVESSGRFVFRHELVRGALVAVSSVGRQALLHREAGRALDGRPDVDPVEVAEHARLGGDLPRAARFLRVAAARAGERYDHDTAERLLDEAIALVPEPQTWLARARVRTRRGAYAEALADVERANSAGVAAAFEVGAWAAYFDRRFPDAIRYAHDGEVSADDVALRARCLIIGGRTRHAAGDLSGAEALLSAAVGSATGSDRVTASAWLGVLRAHQSRSDEALALLSPVVSTDAGVEASAATLHALLFMGHAHAVAGRPAAALDAFARYGAEVSRRHLPRFLGRGVNFTGWVLRNLGEIERGTAAHVEALGAHAAGAIPETTVAALEDLAEERLLAADPDAAAVHLHAADAARQGQLVFGWRLAMKSSLLHARLDLLRAEPEQALTTAEALVAEASAAGVPRYICTGRLLEHRARHRLGMPVPPAELDRDLAAVEAAVALEAWWWIGETTAELDVPGGQDRAASALARLEAAAGPYRDSLRALASRRFETWAATAR